MANIFVVFSKLLAKALFSQEAYILLMDRVTKSLHFCLFVMVYASKFKVIEKDKQDIVVNKFKGSLIPGIGLSSEPKNIALCT